MLPASLSPAMRIAVLALGLLAVPLASDAQPPAHIPTVGVLAPNRPPLDTDPSSGLNAFRQGLRDLGYLEGQNIQLEYCYAEGQLDRLPTLAADLVRRRPDVLFTWLTAGALAAQQATTTIPIVVGAATDLVAQGIVTSLARPGGNLTGLALPSTVLEGKRLEVLKEAVPQLTRVAVLVHPADPAHHPLPGVLEAEARTLGLELQRVEATDPDTFEAAVAAIVHSRAEALLIADHSIFLRHRDRLLELVGRHQLPSVAAQRRYAEAGSLIAYGPSTLEMFRRAAVYVDKILKGAKPAELPIELPIKYDLVINLKTAKELGLTIPPTLLFQADEVIQ
jgi:putative tryptophan/tyrosine transport system substrate-binding protein